jgi:beta-phosphoglucomutase-like phosphatase (HAD superfamily)
VIDAVVFDLDGIIVDSEHVWDEIRRQLAGERGGRWHADASRDMMGMSSVESARQPYPSWRREPEAAGLGPCSGIP